MVTPRRWVVLVAIVGVVATTACGASKNAASPHRPDAVTTTSITATTPPTTATTLAPRTPEACPPGCSLPSDYDAITVLASSASLVAIITVQATHGPLSEGPAAATYMTDTILEAMPRITDGTSPSVPDDAPMVIGSGTLAVGMSYLAFVSFNRGGDCLSALFSYNAGTQTRRWLEVTPNRMRPGFHSQVTPWSSHGQSHLPLLAPGCTRPAELCTP